MSEHSYAIISDKPYYLEPGLSFILLLFFKMCNVYYYNLKSIKMFCLISENIVGWHEMYYVYTFIFYNMLLQSMQQCLSWFN